MIDYKQSGVDVDKGNSFVKQISPIVNSTKTKRVLEDIGPFAAFYSIKDFKKYRHPLLVSSTDGVGTKIKLCIAANKLETAGYDLVAMNVNDIITTGAKPLFFLDYFATSKLDISLGKRVIKGVAKGCKDSNMSLIGGETAELPGFYKRDDFDLAGFAVGIIDKDKAITGKRIKSGDIVVGLPSSGPHSNGYSLIRKVFSVQEVKDYWYKYILKPTRIYVRDVMTMLDKDLDIKGMAHITGGGFYDNIARILPKDLDAVIDRMSWNRSRVFKEIQSRAKATKREMYRTFNMGIGFVVLLSKSEYQKMESIKSIKIKNYVIGKIERGKGEVKII
jgi:phosphoribosylformylglycinamidine cyclo-ligase